MIKLDLRAQSFQFQSRAIFYVVILVLLAASMVIAQLLERSRFGAWLIAVRENEDAAMALGVDAFAVKLGAMIFSAAITAAAGCFYVQYFLFIDSGIAYGTWISIEALLTPIIGGVGTVFGAVGRRAGGQGAGRRRQAGDRRRARPRSHDLRRRAHPGHRFAPRGLVGALADARAPGAPLQPPRSPAGEAAMAEPLLSVENVSQPLRRIAGGGRRFAVGAGRADHRADRSERRRQDHALRHDFGFSRSQARAGCCYGGEDVTGEPPYRLARRGIARTFQIVQPFAGLSVRDNILVGAHLRHSRAPTPSPSLEVDARSALARCLTARRIP